MGWGVTIGRDEGMVSEGEGVEWEGKDWEPRKWMGKSREEGELGFRGWKWKDRRDRVDLILSSQVVSLPCKFVEVANFCAAMDTLVDQDE